MGQERRSLQHQAQAGSRGYLAKAPDYPEGETEDQNKELTCLRPRGRTCQGSPIRLQAGCPPHSPQAPGPPACSAGSAQQRRPLARKGRKTLGMEVMGIDEL